MVGGPAVVQIRDQFRATNQFNGLVVGLKSEARYGMFTASTYAKVGIGEMHERMEIFGGSSFYDPTGRSGVTTTNQSVFNSATGGGAGAAVGGVLANSGNIGTFVHDRFTVIPQAGTNIGIALTRRLTGYIGVSVLYFPDVVRPGYLVNPVVSSASIPFSASYGAAGAANNPNFLIHEVDHWLGGVNFGMKFSY